MRRLAISLLEQRMIRFVLLRAREKALPNSSVICCVLRSRPGKLPRHHQSGLGDAAELPFHQFRSAQGRAQILLRAFALETEPPIFQRHFLEPPQGEEKTVVIDRDQRVAADAGSSLARRRSAKARRSRCVR